MRRFPHHRGLKDTKPMMRYMTWASDLKACYDCTAGTALRTCGGWKRRALCLKCSQVNHVLQIPWLYMLICCSAR